MNEEGLEKVMVNGRYHLPHTTTSQEIQRGMSIVTSLGEKAGFCAGVVVRQGEEDASFVLLGRLPVTAEYRQIPISLIERVKAETIHLNVNCAEILKLPLHYPA